MYRSSIAVFAFAGLALAANSTVQLWVPQNGEPNLVGSIVGSDATATTYSVGCVTEDCVFPTSFLVTEGPSSVEYTYTYTMYETDIPLTESLNCQITDSSSGVCTITAVGSTSPYSTSGVLSTTFTDPSDVMIFITNTAVTITAGAGGSSTGAAATTTGSGSSAKESSSSSTSTSTSGSATGSAASVTTGSASTSGTPSSTSSKAGAAMITQAPWAVGAAAAMVYAAL